MDNIYEMPLEKLYGEPYGCNAGGGSVACENCETIGKRSNGFGEGPRAVWVIDPNVPAKFVARGRDYVCGGRRRDWGEAGEWLPEEKQWVRIPLPSLSPAEE